MGLIEKAPFLKPARAGLFAIPEAIRKRTASKKVMFCLRENRRLRKTSPPATSSANKKARKCLKPVKFIPPVV